MLVFRMDANIKMHADNTLKPSLYSHTLKTEKQQYTPCRMLLDNICQYRDKHSFRYMQVLFKYVPIQCRQTIR